MILDKQAQFSDAQAVTVTAVSTNFINTGSSADSAPGNYPRINIVVDETFATLTSLAFSLETDDNASFTSPATLWSKTYLTAALTAGAKIDNPGVTGACEKYLQLRYTVAGSTATAGKITASLVLDNQNNVPTPDGI